MPSSQTAIGHGQGLRLQSGDFSECSFCSSYVRFDPGSSRRWSRLDPRMVTQLRTCAPSPNRPRTYTLGSARFPVLARAIRRGRTTGAAGFRVGHGDHRNRLGLPGTAAAMAGSVTAIGARFRRTTARPSPSKPRSRQHARSSRGARPRPGGSAATRSGAILVPLPRHAPRRRVAVPRANMLRRAILVRQTA